MNLRGLSRGALLAAAAMGALYQAGMAVAQDGRQRYDIETGNLDTTLLEIGRQSGVEVAFSSAAVAGAKAHALHGTYTAREALDAALAGSVLVADAQDGGFTVRGRSEAAGATGPASPATQDVIVTGSHIRGAQHPSAIIRSREEIEAQGLTDLGAFARSLLENFSGGQNPGVVGGGAQGGSQNLTNSAALNLRGIGQDATLTLINGHRLAYDAIAQGVDISAIPLGAIERVEVLPDGASAIYGSDAVAGVANVILRRDYSGVETSARFGAATGGGDVEQDYGIVTGSRWNGGGVVVSGDFNRSTAITARDRMITRTLDDSATLLPEQRQYAVVASGHQTLADGIEFEVDGQYSNRSSQRSQPYTTTASAFQYGNIVDTVVETYSVSPTMRLHLPAQWEISLNGTYSQSEAALDTRRASSAIPTFLRLEYGNTLYAAEASGEGPLFTLPGGDVRLAVGGGYRSTDLRVYTRSTYNGASTVTSDFSGNRGSFYGYAEGAIPLIGSENQGPIVRSAAVNAAVRYENYPGIADIATPKIGLNIGLAGGFKLSGSWGKSFKAQTLFQEYQLRQGYLFPPSLFIGSSLPAGSSVLVVTGGNRDLKPERAETITTSLEWAPDTMPGVDVKATYFHVDYRDRVATPLSSLTAAFSNPVNETLITRNPSAALVDAILAGLPQGLSNQTGGAFDPAKVAAFVDDGLRNTARQVIEGVDASARYRHDFNAAQRLNVALSASYLRSKQQILPGQPMSPQAGILFNPPHWRGRFLGSWTQSNVLTSLVVNYTGGTLDNRYATPSRVPAYTTVDLVTRITTGGRGIFKGVEATLSVLNLFNEKPSAIRTSDPADPPYDSTNSSAIGRFVGLSLRKAW